MTNSETILKRILDFIEECVTQEEQPNHPEAEVAVVKSVDQMQKIATFVVLQPQDEDLTTDDLHGDWYDADSIREAMVSFNLQCRKAGLEHNGLLSNEDVVIEESYIAPCDFTFEETGAFVKKGTWLQTWKFNNTDLWNDVLAGHFTGVSVECSAVGYEVE